MVYRVQIEILEQSLKRTVNRPIFGLCSVLPLTKNWVNIKLWKKLKRLKTNTSLKRQMNSSKTFDNIDLYILLWN